MHVAPFVNILKMYRFHKKDGLHLLISCFSADNWRGEYSYILVHRL